MEKVLESKKTETHQEVAHSAMESDAILQSVATLFALAALLSITTPTARLVRAARLAGRWGMVVESRIDVIAR